MLKHIDARVNRVHHVMGEPSALQLITTSARLKTTFHNLLGSCEKLHFAVAWASVGFPEYDALVSARQKLGRAVIGTHFYQTAPEFIKKFAADKRVRFVTDHSGVFHPKLYIFESADGGWACLVGSANFTAGGFGRNREACILVTNVDDPASAVLKSARLALDGHWKAASPGGEIDLKRYAEMRKRFARQLGHASGQFGSGRSQANVEDSDALTLSWSKYLSKIRADRHHALDRRLEVLAAARNLFLQHGSFAAMPTVDRQGIAGFRESGDVPWGWFGSMRSAGVFKNIVNRSPRGLSAALDQIPMEGQVSRADYLAFAQRFVRSFPSQNGRQVRHGLGTASRLLAMKRPDYFVCLDSANRKGLLADFGLSVLNHDYEGYWDKIVERILLATWWNARRPTGSTAKGVWDGRAAMLDAIYYSPKL